MRALKQRLPKPDRKTQIVDAAISLFSDKGFSGTKTKQLAAAVGVSEAALFKYFRSKEELYCAILDRKMSESPVFRFPEEEASERNDYAVFLQIARLVLKRHLSDTRFLRLLYFSALEGHDLHRLVYRNQYSAPCQMLADYIALRIGEGAFTPINPEVAARMFFGMIVQYIVGRTVFGDRVLRKSGLDPASLIVKIFLRGIATAPAKRKST